MRDVVYICKGSLEDFNEFKEITLQTTSKDEHLVAAMNKRQCEISDGEIVVLRQDNLLVTNKCMYLAAYGDDLELVERKK